MKTLTLLLSCCLCSCTGSFVSAQVSFTVDGSLVTAWPTQALRPVSNGISQIIVKGDCRKLGTFQPFEAVNLAGEGGIIGSIYLNGYGPYATSGSTIKNLAIDGMIDCRVGDCLIENCNWRDWRAQCIRIRFGGSRCTVRRCTMIRVPPFTTTSDVCAIQLSDGETQDCHILECVILNYTDAIQTTDRANPDGSSTQYGYTAGLIIKGNHLGFTGSVRDAAGTGNIEGCENALDFKTGGTPEKPVIIEGNFIFGVKANLRNPKGYAVTYHRCASDLVFRSNVFADCGSAFFNNIQYIDNVTSRGVFDPRVTLQGNVLASTATLLVGPGKVTLLEAQP